MASLMSIIRNSRFGKAFSAARHAPKGQKMRALNLSLSGGVPAENYAEVKKNLDYRTNSLESMYGPAPNVASLDVSTAYGDMLRLSDLLEETSQIQGTRAEDEDIHLNVWTGKQGIIDTLKAGYAVLEKVAEAYVSQKGPGYMLDGHLMDAAAIALKYKNVATLEGELGIPQLAQE